MSIHSRIDAHRFALPKLDRDRIDRFAERFLGVPLMCCLVVASLTVFLVWLPNYLTWPFWSDLDMSATSALSWSNGVLPYRDILSINFPGQIYLFWLTGTAFGWGWTLPFYAVDASLLAGLGILAALWSRKMFGNPLPGLAGFLTFLFYYLSLDYSLVAQRDWHNTLFATVGLLAMQTWPGRGGRLAGAACFGIAAAFRPFVVLFLPAAYHEVAFGADGARGEDRAPIRRILGWTAALGLFTALMFAPVILNGLVDDLLSGLALTKPAGPYATQSIRDRLLNLFDIMVDIKNLAVPTTMFYLMGASDRRVRRAAVTWLLALGASFSYGPLAPMAHHYHAIPVRLILSLNIAFLVHLILITSEIRAGLRLAMVLLILGIFVNGLPGQCCLRWGMTMAGAISRGETTPKKMPPNIFLGKSWEDYQRTIAYLKSSTSPGTRVANLMIPHCLSLNSLSGRMSVFRFEVPTLIWVEQGLVSEDLMIRHLQETPDSVVVWDPAEPMDVCKSKTPPRLEELPRVVERLYEPSARFGRFEVWRRKGRVDDPGDRLEEASRRPAAADRRVM